MTYSNLGNKFQLKEGSDMKVGYMGYAIKQ